MPAKLPNIVILGAGWLGAELAEKLKVKGHSVQATHKQQSSSVKQTDHYLSLQGRDLIHNLTLKNAYWICCIPPKTPEYLILLKLILELASQLKYTGFLLCSSTGVYPDESNIYDETSVLTLATSKKHLLHDAEISVLKREKLGKVVRLAGLMGPKRHPGKFVAGKELKSSALTSVNMLHQIDAVAGIIYLIENWQISEQIYNLVTPDHPTKGDFYKQACLLLNSEPPKFLAQNTEQRIVLGDKITELGFNYQLRTLKQALSLC